MSLIQEANTDDTFNTQMGKIQDAIERLEKLLPQFVPPHRPVNTQIRMVEVAAEDLTKLAASLKAAKAAS
jgi:hypothetical protein